MAEIEAGRDTDVRVAKVMGWPDLNGAPPDVELDGKPFAIIPHYSTDIAAAFQGVEKMQQAGGWNFAIEFESHLQLWRAWLWREGRVSSQGVTAETAPLVICKAVLKAVGYSPVEREAAGA